METREVDKGMNIHTRRAIAYMVLIDYFVFLSVLVLYPVYQCNEIKRRAAVRIHTGTEHRIFWRTGRICSRNTSGMERYVKQYYRSRLKRSGFRLFSTMTAYAIHAYDFKLKKFIYPFILMIMMIPTQVTALGFVKLVGKMQWRILLFL